MTFIVGLKYRALLYGCKLIGLLPTWFLYHVLIDVVYFLIYKVVRYRVPVVKANLANSFPNYTPHQLAAIEKGFYYHLAELFVDTIDMTSITRAELKSRMRITNVEQVEREMAGKDWIAALAHYGSWEYFGAYQFYTSSQVVGVYRPLHDKAFEKFYKNSRSRFGMQTVSMNVLLRYILKNRGTGRPLAMGLIADQTPAWFEIDHWFDFLNQPTGFFLGMATLAQRFKLPIYFMHLKKLSRAHYEGYFECIYDGTEQVDPHEIVARYASRLEALIVAHPEIWMWSHKRWKHKPKPGMEFNVKL